MTKKKRYKKSISNITADDIRELLSEESIVNGDISEILIDNAMVYYNEILFHRAIPDVRDGLTDVQRRIIWTDFDKGWTSEKPHIKSARVTGEVVGRV